MGKIAHLKVTCPQCRQYTSIYVVEDGSSNAKVKCEHCKQIFGFGAGMMYEFVAYVSSIPNWAIVKETDKVHTAAIKCKKCGKQYSEMDIDLEKKSRQSQGTDDILSALLMNAIKAKVGLTVLYRCSSCGAIACSGCVTDKTGNAFGGYCPYCNTGYTMYSRIEPTKGNVASGNKANQQQEKSQSVSQRPQKPDDLLVWSILATVLCCMPFGIVAIIQSNKVNTLWAARDYVGAQNAANNAKTWCFVSLGVGIVVFIVVFIIAPLIASLATL